MTDNKKGINKNLHGLKKKIFFSKKYFKNKKFEEKEKKVKFLCKKKQYFNVKNTEEINKNKILSNKGRWTQEEQDKFIEGIAIFGTIWKKVKTLIKTRTSTQVRSHAQKFFLKMKTCKDKTLGIDFTLDSIQSIKDMINQIKSVKNHDDIKSVFIHIRDKCDINKKNKKFDEAEDNNNINNINKSDMIISLEEDKKVEANDLKRSKDNNEHSYNLLNNQNNQKNELKNNFDIINLNQQVNNNFSINFSNNISLINSPLLNNYNFNMYIINKYFDKILNDINIQPSMDNFSNPSFIGQLNNINNQYFFNNNQPASNVYTPLFQNPFYLNYLLSTLGNTNI